MPNENRRYFLWHNRAENRSVYHCENRSSVLETTRKKWWYNVLLPDRRIHTFNMLERPGLRFAVPVLQVSSERLLFNYPAICSGDCSSQSNAVSASPYWQIAKHNQSCLTSCLFMYFTCFYSCFSYRFYGKFARFRLYLEACLFLCLCVCVHLCVLLSCAQVVSWRK